MYLPALLVPFGGLLSIDLQVEETITLAPATGRFGGAAVGVDGGAYHGNQARACLDSVSMPTKLISMLLSLFMKHIQS